MEINDEIKNSLDISDIIGEKIKLKRSGRGFVGLCPFHEEKTPSFHVFTDTQTYYCFGCGAAGDIFTFLMKTEGLNFIEARDILAARAGIKIERKGNNLKKEKSLYEILEIAANFFKANLFGVQGAAARAYIQRRNLDKSDCEKFSLGYSLNSWDSLINFLRKAGVKDNQLLNSGLALASSRGLYDRFRGRIIFPVKDVAGRVIAFGGRLIDGEGAKYINSPESDIYSKRKNLYLLNEAKKFIREKDRAILVEGYMDAVRLHKTGFPEAVASLGTSLTTEQAELLSRFSSRCYICYDSDEAGQNAILRGMYILQENGIEVRVVKIPDGKDPDEFLSSNPAGEFEKALENSTPLVLHQIKSLEKMPRKAAVKELFENLSRLNIADVLPYRSKISEFSLIPPTEIEKFLSKPNSKFLIQNSKLDNSEFSTRIFNPNSALDLAFCAMIFYYPECRLTVTPDEALELLADPLAKETAFLILSDNPSDLYSRWLSSGDTEKISLITRGLAFSRTLDGASINDKWKSLFSLIKFRFNSRSIAEIKQKLILGTATNEDLLLLQKLQREKIIQK